MINISDILRGNDGNSGVRPKKQGIITRAVEKTGEVVPEYKRKIEKQYVKPVRSAREKDVISYSSEDIYNEGILLVKEMMDNYLRGTAPAISEIMGLVNKMIDKVGVKEDDLCLFSLESTEQNYMYAHSVNVAILSLKLGFALKLNRGELTILGLAAILHDLGMVKHLDLVNQSQRLSNDELTTVKSHPYETAEYLRQVPDLKPNILSELCEVIAHTHERLNGRGYPRGLLFEEIHLLAQIIGLIDSFEAMTHFRNYREKIQPSQAIEELLRLRKIFFEPQLVKVLVETISLYPIGTCVRINTEEIARVIQVNEGHPTRPVIEVFIDQHGKKLREKKVMDLVKMPMIWVKETVSEENCEG